MVFNQAPSDTSKVVFTVLNGTAPVTVSPTWNAAKTEATLGKSSIYVSGTYTVKVVDNNSDLGTSTITVSEQKVAKIEITSTKLGVTSVTDTATPPVTTQTGYATYKILDQYGVDVTNLAISQNVQFQTGVGSITATKGLLKVSPSTGLNLLTFSGGIVITANDTSSGVSTTATLAATSQIGTLSDITLTTLTNVDGKVLTAGDNTSVFYAGYTAIDLSGNPTTNYEMMKQGLIFQTGTQKLTSSSPNVTAELIQDPADSTKGLIKVMADSVATQIDMPVVITAMTWTGKTSQINTTLKKQAEVDTFTLYSPTEAIADGESKIIPFSAKDQNGAEVTKYSDLFGGSTPLVTLTGAYPVLNNDGTASVKNIAVPNSGTTSIPAVISAVTRTGKYSSITIQIQKTVKADTLSLDSTILMSNMQQGGATQSADFGWDNGGFTVKDQYGRVIDMTTAATSAYKIRVTSDHPSIVSAVADGAGGFLTTGSTKVVVTSAAVGTATVKFELLNGAGVVVDTKSQTFSSIANVDIKDYTMTQLTAPIYIINGAGTQTAVGSTDPMTLSDQEKGFKANPKVYGKTAAGASVVLGGSPIVGATSTSADFTIYQGASGGVYDYIRVVANKLSDPAKTESTAAIIVTVRGADGFMHTVNTPIKSSTAKPAAATVDVSVATEVAGIERDGDVVTLTGNYAALLGPTLAKFMYPTGVAGTQNVYFAPKDQYGTTAANMSKYEVLAPTSLTSRVNGSTFNVDANGTISGSMVTGDFVTVSASTTTGLVKSIKIEFGPSSVTAPTAATIAEAAVAKAEASLLLADYTAANALVGALPVDVAPATTKADLVARLAVVNTTITTTGTTAQSQALAAVNNAVDVYGMVAALSNPNLAMTQVTKDAFSVLLPIQKNDVAQVALTALSTAGFASGATLELKLVTTTPTASLTAAIALVNAANTQVGTLETLATTAVTTPTKVNVDAVEAQYSGAALTAVNNLPASAIKTAYEARMAAAKAEVAAVVTFNVTKGAGAADIKAVLAGTDVTNFTVGYTVTDPAALNGTDPAIAVATGAVTSVGNATAASTFTVTIINTFWAKSDTVTFSVANGGVVVTVNAD